MCGIIGYIGNNQAIPFLLNGLKKLEYRGYDSAGICCKTNNGLFLEKKKGRVSNLKIDTQVDSSLGIGHTRWATHGEPSDINAHPHLSSDKSIAIVHNGIIENATILREELIKKGYVFLSKTDSEVIVHLIHYNYSGDLYDAVQKSLSRLIGTYGLLIIHIKTNEMIVAKNGSPVVIGLDKSGVLVSSDVTAFSSDVHHVQYLQDGDVAVLNDQSFELMRDGKQVPQQIKHLDLKDQLVQKNGFKHFMIKEIFDQPDVLRNTISGRLKNGRVVLSVKPNAININRIHIVGCGTSYHAGLVGKYILEDICQIPVNVELASEIKYRNTCFQKGDVALFISQSGETADTLAALKEIKKQNIPTIGIVNVVGSSIAREVDNGIYTHAGPEVSVASTKAFTSQVTSLILLSLFFAQQKGLSIDSSFVKELEQLPELIERDVLSRANEIEKISEKFVDVKDLYFLGRLSFYPVSLEAALKLKEISYIHAEGFAGGELKHGPLALIDKGVPVIAMLAGEYKEKMASNIMEVKTRGGDVFVVGDSQNPDFSIAEYHPYVQVILITVFIQTLCYHVADKKGIDVDFPKNLAKSVTVE